MMCSEHCDAKGSASAKGRRNDLFADALKEWNRSAENGIEHIQYQFRVLLEVALRVVRRILALKPRGTSSYGLCHITTD